MNIEITRAELITAIINSMLETRVIQDAEVEDTVIMLDGYSDKDLIGLMLEASMKRIKNLERLEEFQPTFSFYYN